MQRPLRPGRRGASPVGAGLTTLAGVVVALAGCGRVGFEIHGDGGAPDALGPNATCWDHWRAHDETLSAPVRLAALDTSTDERNPSLADDDLTLYFARGATGDHDVYRATRATVGAAFTTTSLVAELSSARDDYRVTAMPDGLRVYLASDRAGNDTDVWTSTRPDRASPFGALDKAQLGAVNTSADELDPDLAADGLSLFLAPRDGATQTLAVSTRPTAGDAFGAATPVPLTGPSDRLADPCIGDDGHVLLFTEVDVSGVGDLYLATRPSSAVEFGPPVRVDGVDTADHEGDATLSADGCELMFASDRPGSAGLLDLYAARVTGASS